MSNPAQVLANRQKGKCMGALAVIGIIYIIYKLISEACEKPWENVNYTSAQYQKDFDKVVVGDMTFKQLEKNVHAGKYSK